MILHDRCLNDCLGFKWQVYCWVEVNKSLNPVQVYLSSSFILLNRDMNIWEKTDPV